MTNLTAMTAMTLGCLLGVISGCGPRSTQTMRLTDPLATGPLIVDVNTFRGNVDIRSERGLRSVNVVYKKGSSALLSRLQDNVLSPAAARSLDHIDVQSGITRDTSGRPLCIVTGVTTSPAPQQQWVNFEVAAPDVAGVRVVTTEGQVMLIDVAGPIDVTTEGGTVILATARPLAERVRINVTDGDIDMRITPASMGMFDLDAPNGTVYIRTDDHTRIVIEQTHDSRAQARLGLGSNAIVLRAYNGDISLTISDSPQRGTGPIARLRSTLN
jgi:hypothetical protein